MPTPKITDDPLYVLIREEHIDEFNERIANGEECSLVGCDFRSLDLRKLNVDGLNLEDAYFRNADVRGVDFRNTDLEGASFAGAKISGTYFPSCFSAQEITMSVAYGTRLRSQHNQ